MGSLPLWPLYTAAAAANAVKSGCDSKTLVDLVGTAHPELLLEHFRAIGDHSDGDALEVFIDRWFTPAGSDLEDVYPDAVANVASTSRTPFSRDSLLELMRSLTKRAVASEGSYSTLIPAPNPFVIPAGRFRESYYWDSFWIVLGLLECPEPWATDLCLGIARNLGHMVNKCGFVPNGFRAYYLNRSQPPLLTAMVSAIAARGRPEVAAEFLPVLKKELLFWRENRTFLEASTGSVVSRYWSDWTEPRAESLAEDLETARGVDSSSDRARLFRDICAAAESGWDFSSRWMDERNTLPSLRTTRVLPVDLNAILAKSERLVSEMARDLGDTDTSETFKKMSEEREAALQALFWDERRSKWRDLLIDDGGGGGNDGNDGGRRSVGFARRDDEDYASEWVPLWCLDDPDTLERRRRAVRSLEASKINQPGGMASSSVHTGQQWDWPNVWPPSQYFLAEGCWMAADDESKRLGDSIRDRYMASARRAWGVWNALPEKFDCTVSGEAGSGGEYQCVMEGFGWSIGLALRWYDD